MPSSARSKLESTLVAIFVARSAALRETAAVSASASPAVPHLRTLGAQSSEKREEHPKSILIIHTQCDLCGAIRLTSIVYQAHSSDIKKKVTESDSQQSFRPEAESSVWA